jgi:ribose-phosphate pyrophosphokinase
MAIIDKRRIGNTDTVVPTHLIGDVTDKHCLLIDDEIASGGTLCKAADFLKENGAESVRAAVVHPVLSGTAIDKINASSLDELIVTNTIPLGEKLNLCKKLTVLSVAPLFAKAIQRIHNGDSVSVLFGPSG